MKLTYRLKIDGLKQLLLLLLFFDHAQITILGYQPFRDEFVVTEIF